MADDPTKEVDNELSELSKKYRVAEGNKGFSEESQQVRRRPVALALMAGGCAAGYHRGRGAPTGDPVRPVRRAPLLVRIAPPQQNQLVADDLLSQEMIGY